MARPKKAPIMPELVPQPLWGRSASKMLRGKAAWKTIQQDARAKTNGFCVVCGSDKGQLSCHDKWKYEDKTSTATLVGFELHCQNCDSVAHAGRAIKLGYANVVISHLCALNGWDHERAIEALGSAMDVWHERSRKRWKVVVASALVKKHPELAALPKFFSPPANY
jgi:hypothetical protein